jgi:hypothetical protein
MARSAAQAATCRCTASSASDGANTASMSSGSRNPALMESTARNRAFGVRSPRCGGRTLAAVQLLRGRRSSAPCVPDARPAASSPRQPSSFGRSWSSHMVHRRSDRMRERPTAGSGGGALCE